MSEEAQGKRRSTFSHYLPRLRREFYQGDAVIFWTLPVKGRAVGWLDDRLHAAFRELLLHSAARQGLFCPAYCLMPDHIHLVWMGLRRQTEQRHGMKFLRTQLSVLLAPTQFEHQPYDHVLTLAERQRSRFAVACADYVLLNPYRARLVKAPADWPYLGAVIPGYPRIDVFDPDYWPWFWERYVQARDPELDHRVLPQREME